MAIFTGGRSMRRKLMISSLVLFFLMEYYFLFVDDYYENSEEVIKESGNSLQFKNRDIRISKDRRDNSLGQLTSAAPEKNNTYVRKVCKPINSRLFPLCKEKFEQLKMIWKRTCYKDVHKLDGTDCSILSYLQEIEPYCSKQQVDAKNSLRNFEQKPEMRDNLEGLISLLKEKEFYRMKERMTGLWPEWMDARKTLQSQKSFRLNKRKKVLVFLGAMSYQRWLLTGEQGIMGELVQWADLITSLYVLGHDIQVILDEKNVTKVLKPDEEGCASANLNGYENFDLIFTDIMGFQGMKFKFIGKANLARLKCKMRILDSFGTEAEFNYDRYEDKIPGNRSPWGNLNLHLPQFMTYFPHSPDNTFLGFAAGSIKTNIAKPIEKKNWAVIYGKSSGYLNGQLQYLDIVKNYFELHSTMLGKLFIGLGFPFEGPGPLDAIAQGAVYLNPKFPVPKNKLNDKFFGGKPILRKVTSQNPYLEDFVREPHSYTVDVRDKERLVAVLKKIKSQKVFPPYLPREVTNLGMLEKLNALVEKQSFCDERSPRWPPVENMYSFLAELGVSCKDECHKRGMICEPTYFSDINFSKNFKKFGIDCSKTISVKKLHPPSYNVTSGTCYTQDHYFYFSCVAEYSDIRRLCPCRTYMPGQTAICEGCL